MDTRRACKTPRGQYPELRIDQGAVMQLCCPMHHTYTTDVEKSIGVIRYYSTVVYEKGQGIAVYYYRIYYSYTPTFLYTTLHHAKNCKNY